LINNPAIDLGIKGNTLSKSQPTIFEPIGLGTFSMGTYLQSEHRRLRPEELVEGF
jgi:hypothetical protein